eukprot:NODE_764_length_4412_cov_0.313935.p2 type:complete len:383 gc:universal NODE_764_length_4412_cov_0.313935:3165-2017(-)
MSQKPTFRSRKIDKHRQMCVLLEEDVDFDGTIRDTQNIDYGVDKEEADEEHLLTSLKTQFNTSKKYVPLPDVQLIKRTKREFAKPDGMIRYKATEALIFCASDDDVAFVKKHPGMNINDFELVMSICDEMMMDRVPHATLFDMDDLLHKIVTTLEKPHLEEIIPVIYDHYKTLFLEKDDIIMPILIPAEKYDSDSHPYKSFRPREVATFRKTRQSQSSSSRIKQWNQELNTAHHILQLVLRREKTNKEIMIIDQVIFEKRLRLKLKRKQLGLPEEEQKPPSRPKTHNIGDGIKRRLAMDNDYVDVSLGLYNNKSWQYRIRSHMNNMIIDKNSSYNKHDMFSDEEIDVIDVNDERFKKARYSLITKADWILMGKNDNLDDMDQ